MTREEMLRIKEARGYTFVTLSEYSGVPLGTIMKIFSGETDHPRKATLAALERVLTGDEKDFPGRYYELLKEGRQSNADAMRESTNYMQSAALNKHTIEEYLAFPENERVELIDGHFYQMAAPSNIHQDILVYMLVEIELFIRAKKGSCRVVPAPSAVQLDKDDYTMVEPDLYVVCHPEAQKGKGNYYGAPDFVLEILSPSTRKKDCTLKVGKYITAGVRELWLIDPMKKLLISYSESSDWMPVICLLEGQKAMEIYQGKLVIDLGEISRRIDYFREG